MSDKKIHINIASEINAIRQWDEYFGATGNLLKHKIEGHIGVFVKRVNGYYGEMTIIRMADGREWYAPSHEFIRI